MTPIAPAPRVLVTGGAGFLGSHLCERLLASGAHVLCVDNLHLNDGRVVSNFILQALRGEPITLYGDGLQTRSFCYVDDLIEALLWLGATAAAVTGPVNLGSDAAITIRELAERIIAITASGSRLSFHPLPADDPRQRRPDTTLAEELLAWRPSTALDSGLRRTVAYFEQAMSASTLAPVVST